MNYDNPCIDSPGGDVRLTAPAVPFAWLADVLAGPAEAIIGAAQLASLGIARTAGRIDRRRRYRRTVRELSRLDGRTLRDIGIERGQIDTIARDLIGRGQAL